MMKIKGKLIASVASAMLLVGVVAPAQETKAFWGGFGGGWYDAGYGWFGGYGNSGNDNTCPTPQQEQPIPNSPIASEYAEDKASKDTSSRSNKRGNQKKSSSSVTASAPSGESDSNVTVSSPASNSSSPEAPPSNISQTDQAFAEEALAIVNAHRKDRGIQPLVLDSELIRFCAFKSEDMRDNNYFSHNSPTHGSPWDLSDKLGIKGMHGEVIAKSGNPSASGVIDMWMNSTGHRDILMSPDSLYFGVARRGTYFTGVTGQK